jgi:hypothetical protein
MAQESPSQFAPSWFSVFEGQSSHGREQRQRALDRLWRTFMRARVFIATVLLALQVYLLVSATAGPDWLVLVCALHVTAAIAVLFWLRPARHSGLMQPQWLLTIGVDIVVFALLQFFQQGGFNYMPLFALPVLLASILGPLTLGLAAAAAVTLYLLGEAILSAPVLSDINTARLLQAGLTATGFLPGGRAGQPAGPAAGTRGGGGQKQPGRCAGPGPGQRTDHRKPERRGDGGGSPWRGAQRQPGSADHAHGQHLPAQHTAAAVGARQLGRPGSTGPGNLHAGPADGVRGAHRRRRTDHAPPVCPHPPDQPERTPWRTVRVVPGRPARTGGTGAHRKAGLHGTHVGGRGPRDPQSAVRHHPGQRLAG